MFLIDDVLFAPGKAAYVLFEQLARKAQDEWLNDDAIKQDLQRLYGLLESGTISEKDFEEHECRLLARLEEIARIKFQDKWGEAQPPVEDPVVDAGMTVSALDQPPPLLPPASGPPPLPPPSQQPLPPPLPAARPTMTMTPPVADPPRVPPLAPQPGGPLAIGQVMECAVRALAMLKMRVSTITSVVPDNSNWKVSLELVERRGIPDTNDVLGVYELWLDSAGNVLRYERTQMRRRCDFAR